MREQSGSCLLYTSNREIIVFDEPTSGLDLKHMWEVARSLKSLADQGKTLLVIKMCIRDSTQAIRKTKRHGLAEADALCADVPC